MPEKSAALRFHERFKSAYEQSGFDSYSELSRAAGMSRPVTQKIMSGAFNHSNVGPGIFSTKRLADAMGTSVGYLLGEDLRSDDQSQAFFNGTGRQKGTIEQLMEIHWRGAGRIEAFDKMLEDCDVYSAPTEEDTTPQIQRVGKRTLFAGRLGGPFVRDAQTELNAFSAEKKADVLEFQRRVVRDGTAIGNSYLDHNLKTRPARVSASNIRLGLLVEDHKGQRSVLIHAAPIPA
ncbi:hypothetical protein [Tritonibacter mobilis]|uniref:hypothetical protein n=1 Tax=Tritonibacter mobilis TaxID=379347 RepID=UPI001C09DB5B|nr:hypothetical protein [Tritonibacter mobilis]MBU3035956.1 hypothetical protein [Tritonibacter mobilis]WHQ85325.1 hypothetical protein OMR53_21850 [Tritonibacter mobilis]